MQNKLLFRFLIISLILLPILSGALRQITFGIIIILSSFFLMKYLKENNFKLSLKKENITGKILIISLILMSYSIINSTINNFNINGAERLLQLYTCLAVLVVSSTYNWKKKDYLFCLNVIKIIVFISLLVLPFSTFKGGNFSGIFSSSNTLGGVLFCYLGIYLLVNRKYKAEDIIIITLILILIYLSNSRSIFVAALLFITFKFLFIKKILKNNKIFLYIVIIIFTLFPIIYVNLYNSELRIILNEFSRKYFSKNFFSGRQIMWQYLLDLIKERMLFGYGLSVSPESLVGLKLSSHNWYIQIILQTGIIGYILLINVFNIIWNVAKKMENYFLGFNTCAFLIGVLTWQGFEVALTQNNIQIGIFVWFILGSGINQKLSTVTINT